MSVLRILHLVGSPENNFYCNLSRFYAKNCIAATANPSLYEFLIAYITPDQQWRFPPSLNPEDIATAKSMSLCEAINFITAQKIDLVLPQMFCIPGMIQYRGLFDLLNIPCVGNTIDVMTLGTYKDRAKAIVAAAKVKVPNGEIIRHKDIPTIKPPAIVKPASSDNSMGVTLVKDVAEYDSALKTAFEHSDEVLIEEYIELGREVRCGIIVKDGKLICLPLIEYLLNAQSHPIRKYSDKYKQREDGELYLSVEDNINASWIVDANDPVTKLVHEAAKKCHQALGCRCYSLFDFRIDPQGQPWFLEAGLYCSFSNTGSFTPMIKASGISVSELLMMAINETLNP